MKFFAVFGLFFLLFWHSSRAAFSQDFSSLDSDLQQLESLIADTLANTQEQQKLLDDLRGNLIESGNLIADYESIITGQENLLKDLRSQLNAMSETYRMQSSLSAKYERSSKFWRTFTLIAIPVTALVSGGVVWAVTSK
jgi:CHASE3 domain sensor protein